MNQEENQNQNKRTTSIVSFDKISINFYQFNDFFQNFKNEALSNFLDDELKTKIIEILTCFENLFIQNKIENSTTAISSKDIKDFKENVMNTIKVYKSHLNTFYFFNLTKEAKTFFMKLAENNEAMKENSQFREAKKYYKSLEAVFEAANKANDNTILLSPINQTYNYCENNLKHIVKENTNYDAMLFFLLKIIYTLELDANFQKILNDFEENLKKCALKRSSHRKKKTVFIKKKRPISRENLTKSQGTPSIALQTSNSDLHSQHHRKKLNLSKSTDLNKYGDGMRAVREDYEKIVKHENEVRNRKILEKEKALNNEKNNLTENLSQENIEIQRQIKNNILRNIQLTDLEWENRDFRNRLNKLNRKLEMKQWKNFSQILQNNINLYSQQIQNQQDIINQTNLLESKIGYRDQLKIDSISIGTVLHEINNYLEKYNDIENTDNDDLDTSILSKNYNNEQNLNKSISEDNLNMSNSIFSLQNEISITHSNIFSECNKRNFENMEIFSTILDNDERKNQTQYDKQNNFVEHMKKSLTRKTDLLLLKTKFKKKYNKAPIFIQKEFNLISQANKFKKLQTDLGKKTQNCITNLKKQEEKCFYLKNNLIDFDEELTSHFNKINDEFNNLLTKFQEFENNQKQYLEENENHVNLSFGYSEYVSCSLAEENEDLFQEILQNLTTMNDLYEGITSIDTENGGNPEEANLQLRNDSIIKLLDYLVFGYNDQFIHNNFSQRDLKKIEEKKTQYHSFLNSTFEKILKLDIENSNMH